MWLFFLPLQQQEGVGGNVKLGLRGSKWRINFSEIFLPAESHRFMYLSFPYFLDPPLLGQFASGLNFYDNSGHSHSLYFGISIRYLSDIYLEFYQNCPPPKRMPNQTILEYKHLRIVCTFYLSLGQAFSNFFISMFDLISNYKQSWALAHLFEVCYQLTTQFFPMDR